MKDATPLAPAADPVSGTVWTRPDRGARGPQPEHSRVEIAGAGVVLADSGGLPAVSMRAVAGELGTTAGALYRYVTSRDELLDLMVDAVLGELELDRDPTPNWLDDLVLLAKAQLALYRRHHWLLEASLRTAIGPNGTNYFEQCLHFMAPLDCSTATKLEATAMITGVVSLFARAAAQPPARTPAHPFASASPDAHPYLTAALARPGTARHQEDLFDRTIRSILLGLLTERD
ncbi:MAG: helix-turn-helix domain-containing protein [Nakamurella sp.]